MSVVKVHKHSPSIVLGVKEPVLPYNNETRM